jgi:chemotaxis protein methyltransferase CheR
LKLATWTQRWLKAVAEPRGTAVHAGDWSQPQFAAIATMLHEQAGLVFPANRRDSAEAGMRRTMAASCISDPRDLLRAISADSETRAALITELTIGETFFFREPGQFEFVRNTVLPALRTGIAHRRLRIWSAGCATGEEPYTIAMLLKEVGWPTPSFILGTDLAAARLAAARRARYTAWSMRGVAEDVIARNFQRQGKQFLLREDIRRAVEFSTLNLASADYPSSVNGVERMDIIFCRNVLIYFDMPTVASIAERLLGSLAPGGWLFLGASDPAIADLVPCEVVLTGAGLAYRPAGTTEGVSPSAPSRVPAWSDDAWQGWAPAVEPSVDEWLPVDALPSDPANDATGDLPDSYAAAPGQEGTSLVFADSGAGYAGAPEGSYASAYEQADYDAAARLARIAIARGDGSEGTWIILIRSLANRGLLAGAGEACAAALEAHPLSPALIHLHAVLLAEAGLHVDAAAAARRALYLDSSSAVAHLALGDALARTDDRAGARRAFTNAVAILEKLDPATPVPGADGAEASQLLGIARFRLSALQASAATGAR